MSHFLQVSGRLLPLVLVALAAPAHAQQAGDTVTVVAGARYQTPELRAQLIGGGWRDLWTTPIRVPVADLSELGGGGLTPMRLGGGMTTQTLHMRGADGRRYVMRSVDKTPGQGLEERLQGTVVEDILQDQISSQHPAGALVVAGLLDATDILHVTPTLYVLPDDPRLGQFREQFAGMLVLFEERPDDGPDGTAGFAGSRKIEGTPEVLDELEDSADDRVDAVDFLRGRLIDLLVGDRDRSVNNFLWARFDEEDDRHVWRAVPRDRDQAFVQFDGGLKNIGRIYEPRFVTFDEQFPSIVGLTRNAWDMDRTMLVSVSREEWDAAVRWVQETLTDEVIEDAVNRMPVEYVTLVGSRMYRTLRTRRDNLAEASEEFYRIVFQAADIHATDEEDIARVERLADGSVRVRLMTEDERLYFDRTFDPEETEEIRLYMHGGADQVAVEGNAGRSIAVHVIGGGGRDQLIDISSADGLRTLFYDSGDGTSFVTGPTTAVLRQEVKRPRFWMEMDRDVDFGGRMVPLPVVGYSRDFGLFAGTGFSRTTYQIGAEARTRTSASAAWAFGAQTPIVSFEHFQRLSTWPVALDFRGTFTGVEVLNFFGYGNETVYPGEPSDFRIDQKTLEIGVFARLGDELAHVDAGPVFRSTWSDELNPPGVDDIRPGAGHFQRVGFEVSWEVDRRNLSGFATSGFRFTGSSGLVHSEFSEADDTYGHIESEASTYLGLTSATSLALRAGGRHTFGEDVPYSESAFLGGQETLRGLPRQRYVGDDAVYGSAELRQSAGEVFLVFPSEWGVFGFGDGGRVFLDGESSEEWHTGWGGGLWLAPLRRTYTIRATIARSEGQTAFYTGMGLSF